MSHLEIILPFGIPPTPHQKELVRQMSTPSLAHLLGYAKQGQVLEFDEFSRLLPHERWLTSSLSTGHEGRQTSAPLTHLRMQEFSLLPESGYWFSLSPVHIHVARDHLVMMDQRRLKFEEAEARTLFEAAKSLCEEVGKTLIYGDAKTWFLRADDWSNLQTASLDAASGHNMTIWIAEGDHARAWRTLQNEIQMLWHIHPINQAREERGERPINSVWLHSGSAELANSTFQNGEQGLSQLSGDSNRICLPNLIESAINGDAAEWLAQINCLETTWFLPLQLALKNKEISSVDFYLSDSTKLAHYHFTSGKNLRFWRKPTLKSLLALTLNMS
ncbi:MAG: hypothetical protein K2P84_11510 [Undibacterium sp.]|nr:hypothetical protein [Undibacterium sp.]